jgi:hypothetical protein
MSFAARRRHAQGRCVTTTPRSPPSTSLNMSAVSATSRLLASRTSGPGGCGRTSTTTWPLEEPERLAGGWPERQDDHALPAPPARGDGARTGSWLVGTPRITLARWDSTFFARDHGRRQGSARSVRSERLP